MSFASVTLMDQQDTQVIFVQIPDAHPTPVGAFGASCPFRSEDEHRRALNLAELAGFAFDDADPMHLLVIQVHQYIPTVTQPKADEALNPDSESVFERIQYETQNRNR